MSEKHVVWPPYEEWKAKIKSKVTASTSKGCVLWTGTRTACGYGQVNIKWWNEPARYWQRKTVYVHRLALMAAAQTTVLSPDMEASHLCHEKLCVNTLHLNLEPGYINASRKTCAKNTMCMEHGGAYPNCIF